MEFHIRAGQRVELHYSSGEPEAVKIAVGNLARDLGKVLSGTEAVIREASASPDNRTEEENAAGKGASGERAFPVIVIGTLAGQSRAGQCGMREGSGRADCPQEAAGVPEKAGSDGWQCSLKEAAADLSGGGHSSVEQVIDRSRLMSGTGMLRKEAYQLLVRDGTLYIAGTDRRGTIYGIYTFCQWMGVSPWYFLADVPVRKRRELTLEEGYCVTDWPSVEYRGIFINDEEELEAWVQNYMGEPTIGVKTYEKIFELLLRLRANYIWPAMHVNSFNLTPENGALADRMGIVVGTSHCDMLMRSNNREWKPWIRKKGYADAVYDYSIGGRNRDILKEYWRESVEQNREFEVCYTLGMRGIHDSGFETKELEGSTEEERRRAKIELLGRIIADQREILRETLGHETMMTFIPYKEVLELYDNGLEIPEDMTLVWANDNYGYIRRYPSDKEKGRKGGNGIYYHNSYWAPPSMSYVFLCSIPLAHTRNELQKAWDEGIRKLWVLNCGAMKPLEQEITFFLRLAWEIGKPGALTEDVEAFVEDWIDHTFTGNIGGQVSALLNDFSQLTNVRKPENMDYDAFSQTAYGDEAAMRIHRYEALFARGNALYEKLPEEERDAFFQLVLMRIQAAYFTSLAYYYGDRSTLLYDRGNMQGARLYTEKSREAEDARRRLLHYYNHVMSGGKWNGILNPEGFPPPRAAMMPVCTPPLWREGGKTGEPGTYSPTESNRSAAGSDNPGMEAAGRVCEGGAVCFRRSSAGEKPDDRLFTEGRSSASMEVYLWNEGEELCFAAPGEKWLEIGNTGTGEFEVCLRAPEWAELSEERAVVRTEKRILVRAADTSENRDGEIVIENISDGTERRIPVRTRNLWADSPCDAPCRKGNAVSFCAPADGGMAVWETGSGEPDSASCDVPYRKGNVAPLCAPEDGGMVALEAVQAWSGLEPSGDFRVIPRLGRMQGSLVEARVRRDAESIGPAETGREPETGGKDTLACPLCYSFVTCSKGEFLLEIHRFPSLDSVGRIRIGVSLDDGPVRIVESFSNDEWRGNWKKNVLNNVDRLYLKLSVEAPGYHRLSLWAVDKYFAFSRLVIYTEPRKENNLAGIRASQPLPWEWEAAKWCDDFYGKYELPPRPVFYAAIENSQDTLAVTCRAEQAQRYAEPVEPDWYLNRGRRMFEEIRGAVKIDAAAALAQSGYAWTREPREDVSASHARTFCSQEEAVCAGRWEEQESAQGCKDVKDKAAAGKVAHNGLWRHCAGESFGRSGLALYIRTPELSWQGQNAPSLNYRFVCQGGRYTLWMLSKFNVREEGCFSVGFDGVEIPEERICAKGSLWRYEAEQIYRWVPVTQAELAAGEHVLHVYALASGMRYDRFYLTKGGEQPPMDAEWQKPQRAFFIADCSMII